MPSLCGLRIDDVAVFGCGADDSAHPFDPQRQTIGNSDAKNLFILSLSQDLQ